MIGKIFLTILWVISFIFVLTNNPIKFSPFLNENLASLLAVFIIIHLAQYFIFFKKLRKEPFRGYHFLQILFFGMIHVRGFIKK
tara:strand:- start:123 stop:374 length:252 start_codon:yes stop_codon:yes gene_type:complete